MRAFYLFFSFSILFFAAALAPVSAQEAGGDPRAEERGLIIGGDDAGAAPVSEDAADADQTDAGAADGGAADGDQGGAMATFLLILRLVIVLALVAAAVYGAVFVLRKISRQSAPQSPFLKVLASRSLGANKAVYVVAVGEKAWLVGAGENGGVSLIAELTDKETVDAMLLEDSRGGADGAKKAGFAALFSRWLPQTAAAPAPVEESANDEVGAEGASKIKRVRERLEGLRQ